MRHTWAIESYLSQSSTGWNVLNISNMFLREKSQFKSTPLSHNMLIHTPCTIVCMLKRVPQRYYKTNALAIWVYQGAEDLGIQNMAWPTNMHQSISRTWYTCIPSFCFIAQQSTQWDTCERPNYIPRDYCTCSGWLSEFIDSAMLILKTICLPLIVHAPYNDESG